MRTARFSEVISRIGIAVVFILLELASVLTLSLAPIGRVQCLLFTRLAGSNH